MIDASPTITALTMAIAATHEVFARLDANVPDNARDFVNVENIDARPEVTDARALLARLNAAAAAYVAKWSTSHTSIDAWLASYQVTFGLLDRHARYTLSLTTSAPSALSFSADATTHDTIAARATSAAASAASADALAALATYRARFDTSWSSKPTLALKAGADASTEGVALTSAITSADQAIAFMAWAASNPT